MNHSFLRFFPDYVINDISLECESSKDNLPDGVCPSPLLFASGHQVAAVLGKKPNFLNTGPGAVTKYSSSY